MTWPEANREPLTTNDSFMPDDFLLPVSLTLFAILVSAGVVLRMSASLVQHYATRQGTPRLSTGIQIIGLSFLGLGLSLGGVATVFGLSVVAQFGLFAAANQSEYIMTACAQVLAVFLIFAGAYLWRWGLSIRGGQRSNTDQWKRVAPRSILDRLVNSLLPMRDAESGTTMIVLLSWAAGLLSVAFCLAAVIELGFLWIIVPLDLACLGMLFLVELMLWWNRQGHQQMVRLWQIYLAVHSGRPLAGEVQLLSDFAWGRERQKLLDVCDDLEAGGAVEDAFLRPMVLSNLEGAQVALGLKAGRLPEVLREMLQQRTARSSELQGLQDRISSTLYLWLLLMVLIDIVGFIMYWIIPKFKKIFDDYGTELPSATKVLIGAADGVVSYWYLGFPVLLCVLTGHTVVSLLPFARSFPRIRVWFARVWPRICIPDILRSLALAAEARLPLETALVPFVRRQFQIPLHSRLIRVQEAVREGGDCWIELADERLLTAAEAALLRSAQTAGNLPWALRTLGQRVEQRWYFRLLFCLEFVQPALLIAVACVVGLIMIAFFLPLVKLINDLC